MNAPKTKLDEAAEILWVIPLNLLEVGGCGDSCFEFQQTVVFEASS